MRIATWNIERPTPKQAVKNEARLEKIHEIDANIWILTESHELIDLSDTHNGAATEPSYRKPRPGEYCAAVWSCWPILWRFMIDARYQRMKIGRSAIEILITHV